MNSIAHQNISLTRGEQLIIDYLKENGEFIKAQKYLAKAIGYRRDTTCELLRSLRKKKLITVEHRKGIDNRLKVIALVENTNND